MTVAPDTDLLLPEDARLLHVGPQKTGSTALQAATQSQVDTLAEHGVTALGVEPSERQALWAALMHPGSTERRYRSDIERWKAMVEATEQASGRVFLTNESMGKADRDGARRMTEALGGERAHVVAVARRLDRLLPSQWQQRVRMNATTLSYEEWLDVVLGDHPEEPAWQNIWVPHDIGGLVERWSDAASRDRFTLVVADESDRRLLSRTVEGMLGLPAGLLRPTESHRTNASLSLGRLELIRHLNRELESRGWSEDAARRAGQLQTTVRLALKRTDPEIAEGRVPPLPAWARGRVAELSAARAACVRSLGVRVVGNPDHLLVPGDEPSAADDQPAVVTATLAADVVAEAIAAALERERGALDAKDKELERLRSRVRSLRRQHRRVGPEQLTARQLASELGSRVRQRLPF